jgi:hypothetical protein
MNIRDICRNGLMCLVCITLALLVAMGLDVFAERRFVQEIKRDRLNGLRLEDAVSRFGLRATRIEDDFYGLMRVRRLCVLWRAFGCDDKIEAYVEVKDGVVMGAYTVISFPSMSPVHPVH